MSSFGENPGRKLTTNLIIRTKKNTRELIRASPVFALNLSILHVKKQELRSA